MFHTESPCLVQWSASVIPVLPSPVGTRYGYISDPLVSEAPRNPRGPALHRFHPRGGGGDRPGEVSLLVWWRWK